MNEQEYDNSAVHLAHCYQGEYPVCKYGDENCPAIPKVKAQPEQKPVARLVYKSEGSAGPPARFEAQPEQEPVAIVTGDAWETDIRFLPEGMALPPDTKLYTHPPQRTWVELTDVEIDYLLVSTAGENEETHISFARAIEAKLKQKNG